MRHGPFYIILTVQRYLLTEIHLISEKFPLLLDPSKGFAHGRNTPGELVNEIDDIIAE